MQGYQLFTQALGVLELKEARDAFLSSLCSFALSPKMGEDAEGDLPMSPLATTSGSGALAVIVDQQQIVKHTNVVAIRQRHLQAAFLVRTMCLLGHRKSVVSAVKRQQYLLTPDMS